MMILKNLRIWSREGFAEDCYLTVEGSRIHAIGPMSECPMDGESLDCRGYTAYPGFIDAHSHLGMFDDSIGAEGEDGNESTDPITPQLRGIDSVYAMDRGFADALAAGVTTVVTGPGSANAIAGTFCAVKTYGRIVDEMVIKSPVAMKMAFGENPKGIYGDKSETPSTRMATAALVREQLFKAQRYMQDLEKAAEDPDEDEPEFDMKCEALLPVLRRELPVHIHAHRADDIATAVRICHEFGLRYVLVHATEGHLIADYLAKKNISIICGPMINHRSKPELSGFVMDSPTQLAKAGIPISICTDHPEIPQDLLAVSAGLCVREGLPWQTAMEAITWVPAVQAGIEDRVGSLAPGLDADLVLFDTDPLTLEARPALVMVNGQIIHKKFTE